EYTFSAVKQIFGDRYAYAGVGTVLQLRGDANSRVRQSGAATLLDNEPTAPISKIMRGAVTRLCLRDRSQASTPGGVGAARWQVVDSAVTRVMSLDFAGPIVRRPRRLARQPTW